MRVYVFKLNHYFHTFSGRRWTGIVIKFIATLFISFLKQFNCTSNLLEYIILLIYLLMHQKFLLMYYL